MLYGEGGFDRLQNSLVAIVGLGGVGSYAAEALVRAGIGRLRLIDCDVIKASDINRQLLALSTNVGTAKVEAATERLLSINPSLALDARHAFFHTDTAHELITGDLDFVIDAIDSVGPKGELIRDCLELKIPIISTMGAAGKTDPFLVKIDLLENTSACMLARAVRRYLRSRKTSTAVPVVYSTERSVIQKVDATPAVEDSGTYLRGRRRRPLPSLSTMPAMFGLIAAAYVIRRLLEK
jgi:tRNA A37 threonylcarbamoyladenosine dehydratase